MAARALALVAAVVAAGAMGACRGSWLDPVGVRPRDPLSPAEHRTRGLAALATLPGAALGHLERAEQGGALERADRAPLGRLLRARARARLALGDPGAAADLERAHALDPGQPDGAERADAAFLSAARALARAGGVGAKDAATALARAETLAPRDPRVALCRPRAAPLGDIAVALHYLVELRARRAALELGLIYLERGGRAADTLAAIRELYAWWYGAAAAPPFSARADGATLAGPDQPAERALRVSARLASDLAAIAGRWPRDPAAADRALQAQLDRDVLPTPRALAASDLFLRLGDPARAARMATLARNTSPSLPEVYAASARAAAAGGDLPRAEVFLADAAARSGDGGAVYAEAAAWLLERGEPLAAIGASRVALGLIADGPVRAAVFRTLQAAQRALGRVDDAARTQKAAESERDAAAALSP